MLRHSRSMEVKVLKNTPNFKGEKMRENQQRSLRWSGQQSGGTKARNDLKKEGHLVNTSATDSSPEQTETGLPRLAT